ncbi:MAG: DUF1553 domain-containing protein [Verrucomicrobia bacterium]|nr:DUF1553 domain-containing protein [Verrucomicrobiota bacterium]
MTLFLSMPASGVVIAADTAQAAGANHWAFVRPERPLPPNLRDAEQAHNPIDRFILARLEKEGLKPSSPAKRATLIRRVSLDLLGLPPSPEEVDAFVNDPRPEAYEQLVDRLLASPTYGERWGRHWLDLARYADSNGYTRDFPREIWKYRDWVIDALNQNMPFDQFTLEQLAGDLLPNATPAQQIATGFHRNTLFNEEGGTDPEQFRVDAVADRVATTGAVFLGLTIECARCHSHKYDPISQREYYELFAFLNNCDEPMIDAPSEREIARGDLEKRKEIRARIAALEKELQGRRDEFLKHQLAWEKTITPEMRARLPGPTQTAVDQAPDKRDDAQKKLVADLFKTTDTARRLFPVIEKIAELQATEPVIPTTLVLKERTEPRETRIHKRGNFLEPGDKVNPSVPAVLHPLAHSGEPPNRVDLARWLTDPANPLTARVVVNRYWQRFFGQGLVETENDFGTQGSRPTHPDLLDWLACEFVASGWNVKTMHRLIVMSATYRQSSAHRPDLQSADPANRLLGRQNRLRVDAEVVRDAALTVSGLLTREIGGPSVFPPQPEGVFEFTQDPKPWKTADGKERYRRALYTHFWRSSPYPALMVFDAPNANVTCTRRTRSNTPLQALTLANDHQFIECARALADRLFSQGAKRIEEQVAHAFRLCLSRGPRPEEANRLADLLAQQTKRFAERPEEARQLLGRADGDGEQIPVRAAWTFVARVLMNVDEFVTRE